MSIPIASALMSRIATAIKCGELLQPRRTPPAIPMITRARPRVTTATAIVTTVAPASLSPHFADIRMIFAAEPPGKSIISIVTKAKPAEIEGPGHASGTRF